MAVPKKVRKFEISIEPSLLITIHFIMCMPNVRKHSLNIIYNFRTIFRFRENSVVGHEIANILNLLQHMHATY